MKGNILNFTAENAVPAFRFAKVGTADGNVKLAAAGDAVLGVSTDINSVEGRPCDVQFDGIAKIELGGSVTFGDKLASDANGKAVAATDGEIGGIALDSGVSGDFIRVKLVTLYVPAAAQESPAEGGNGGETTGQGG